MFLFLYLLLILYIVYLLQYKNALHRNTKKLWLVYEFTLLTWQQTVTTCVRFHIVFANYFYSNSFPNLNYKWTFEGLFSRPMQYAGIGKLFKAEMSQFVIHVFQVSMQLRHGETKIGWQVQSWQILLGYDKDRTTIFIPQCEQQTIWHLCCI